MCSQDGLFIEVVGIRSASADMIYGGVEGIEVLMCRDDRGEVVVVVVTWKSRLDQLSRKG